MTKYKTLAVKTKFWRPGHDFLNEIKRSIKGKVSNGDFLVLSEKAISTAMHNIVDESTTEPTRSAKMAAKYWMRLVWGYILAPICHLSPRLRQHLREYPLDFGSRHKQVAFQHVSFFQALMFGSEGGIDGSNLAHAYVSLPLANADEVSSIIADEVSRSLNVDLSVLIVDTDKTYSLRNLHFTPRSNPVTGINSCGGFVAYTIGRALKLKKRPTPTAFSGDKIHLEEMLKIADIANRARGFGSGRTVWDMAEKFNVGLANVTWEMLETVKHKPIVIVRKRRR